MKKLTFLIPGLAALAAIGTLGDASYAALAPMAGIAQQPSQATCFSNGNGTITNTCAGVRQFCMATHIATSGSRSVRAVGFRPNGGTLQCHAVSVDQFGGAVTGTGNVPLNVVNVDTAWTIGTINVPGFGAAYACCDLSQNARIDTINIP